MYLRSENSSDKENKSGTEDESVPPFTESKDVKLDLILADRKGKNQNDDIVQDEVPDEGWREAFPKGRSTTNRKSSSSMRPCLVKLSNQLHERFPIHNSGVWISSNGSGFQISMIMWGYCPTCEYSSNGCSKSCS
ncbi:hypothetical protein RHSIM_Rhsim01G0021900 [Rhododendron simsii]|uniref:Uncharacterized protein n=1 Tax=Rhododendron simsii TaxID=118357 RepID=A0A834HIS8_RHOSS|nr:hypothetical protein RHSIM_Rhsim01G0021900 [Rhododendron simsii]